MSPSSAITHCGYKAHGNVEPISEGSTRAVCARCGSYLKNVRLGQLRRWHLLPVNAFEVGSRPPMTFASCNPFGRLTRPMGIAPRHFGNSIRCQLPAFRAMAMALSVRHILLCCRPIKIVRGIVAHVAVTMGAMGFVGWLRAIEGLADKTVNLASDLALGCTQYMRQIAAPMSRWSENSPRIFALPIRVIPTNPTNTRNRIIWGFGNGFPHFIHGGFMASFAYNVKLLTRSRAAEAALYRRGS